MESSQTVGLQIKHFDYSVLLRIQEGLLRRVAFGISPMGELLYEKVGDARWKIWIKPQKETNLGEAQALFDS